MEAWRKVWREGIAPLLPTLGLEALLKALKEDDPRLLQDATTRPPPLQCVQDWPCEAADAIAFCHVVVGGGWPEPLKGPARTDGGCPVGDAEEFWARVMFECDAALGQPAACRLFLNWWDDTPRQELFRLMVPEVKRELARRQKPELCKALGVSEDIPDDVLHDLAIEAGVG